MPEVSNPTILALETAGAALSVAVCRGATALTALHLPMQRGHVELLLPAIERVLATARVRLAAIAAVATTVGPGSFTGLRTGLAAAQGLAYGASLPLVGIDRYRALASSLTNMDGRAIAVAFDSKAGSLFVQALGPDLRPLAGWPAEGRNLTAEEAAAALKGLNPVLAGDGTPMLLAAGVIGQDTTCRTLTATMVAAAARAELVKGRTGWPPHPLYLAPPRAKLPKDGGRLRARAD